MDPMDALGVVKRVQQQWYHKKGLLWMKVGLQMWLVRESEKVAWVVIEKDKWTCQSQYVQNVAQNTRVGRPCGSMLLASHIGCTTILWLSQPYTPIIWQMQGNIRGELPPT